MSERNGHDDDRDDRRDDRDMEDDDRDRKVEEVMDIEKEDAAFVLGRGGSTKRKIARVCGADTPFPLAFEKLYLPDELKVYDAIKTTVEY